MPLPRSFSLLTESPYSGEWSFASVVRRVSSPPLFSAVVEIVQEVLLHRLGRRTRKEDAAGSCLTSTDANDVIDVQLACLRCFDDLTGVEELLVRVLAHEGELVEAERALERRLVHHLARRLAEEVVRREHLLGLLNGCSGDGHEHAHRVAVEVGVVAAGDERVNLNGVAD